MALTALRAEQGTAVQIETTARDRVEGLVSKLETLVNRTHDEKRESMLLGASRELRASIELLARLSGELRPENQTTRTCSTWSMRSARGNSPTIFARRSF
jgi:hypothetical protein